MSYDLIYCCNNAFTDRSFLLSLPYRATVVGSGTASAYINPAAGYSAAPAPGDLTIYQTGTSMSQVPNYTLPPAALSPPAASQDQQQTYQQKALL